MGLGRLLHFPAKPGSIPFGATLSGRDFCAVRIDRYPSLLDVLAGLAILAAGVLAEFLGNSALFPRLFVP